MRALAVFKSEADESAGKHFRGARARRVEALFANRRTLVFGQLRHEQ